MQQTLRDDLITRIAEASAMVGEEHGTIFSGENQLLSMLDHLPDMIYMKDCDSRFIFANAATVRMMGMSFSELVGKQLGEINFLGHHAAVAIRDKERRVMESGEGAFDVEEQLFIRGGHACWFLTTQVPMRDSSGRIIGIAGISRDITERKRQDMLRRGHAALLEMIVNGQPLEMILSSLVLLVESMLEGVHGSVLLFDPGNGSLKHGAAPSLPESYIRMIDGLEMGPAMGSCGTAAWRRETVIVCDTFSDPLWADYTELAVRHGLRSCWSTPISGPADALLGTFALYSGTVRSPTPAELELIDMATSIAGIAIDRRHADDRVHFMAHHDPLTGLSNRTLFWAQFSRALHEAKREDRMVAITYIDLDNFKQINDFYGHAAGDDVLRAVAERLRSCIRASDIAVRLGGDEFAIVFSNPNHDEIGVVRRLDAIREAISAPIAIKSGAIATTCSMGVAFFPRDGDTPETLLAQADAAMYDAKHHGRDRLKLYVDQHGSGA